MVKRKNAAPVATAANVGYEAQLWQMADALRGSMDAAEYKHVVLGLIFLKYISDAFEEQHAKLDAERAQGADPEDPDEYRALSIFWVPPEARWSHLKAQAKQPTVGQLVDDAMAGIERDNPSLKGVLPNQYGRPNLDKQRLGQLIDLVSNIKVGDAESRSKDVIGRVYEYFLSQFASAEGKKGGEFYTPRCVVKLLVEMIEPYKGRVYDPCCGSSGMFVQSVEFIRAHATTNGNGGKAKSDISIYGQESNYTTWRLARMNLAIRGIDGQIAHGDTFHNDRHPDLKADFILANPPFNVSDWRGELLRDDKRWQYGAPPASNANFAWVQHIIHHLAPAGLAGFVLANGSMSSGQSGEGEIRKSIIEADLVDCMVALPGQLFYSTQIPACLWFLARDKKNGRFRDRRKEVLFIDARKLGQLVDRTHRELTDEEIARIGRTYHAWRGEKDAGVYADVPGFCKSASLEEVRKHGYVLTPGRHVGAAAQEDDGEAFEEKMQRLASQLREQMAESGKLDAAIEANLRSWGMAGDWAVSTLGKAPLEIIDGDRGTNYPKQSDFHAEGDCLFLNAGNVTSSGFDFSECAFISAEKDAALRKGKLIRNDVVLTTRGTVGNAAYFDGSVPFDRLRINSGMVILRAQPPALIPRYLYLFVRSGVFHGQVLALRTGSAQPQLPIRDINRIEIPIPPPDEQSAIAHILGALDDKIELNRRMNETLEAMVRALFQSWFVDFDPVRAKAEGGDPGLPKEIADLFPDRFEDSELGEIPARWEVRALDRIADYLNGLALQKYPPGDGPTFPVIKIAQLRKDDTDGADRCSTNVPSDYVIGDGDVLFSWSGSLECVLWAGGQGALNQHLFKVTSTEFPKWFYYLWIHQHLKSFRKIAAGKATTMGHIQRHHLSDAKVAVPESGVLNAANKVIAPMIEQITQRCLESRTLATLRDTLLPKLVSGELRVRDAQRFVGGVDSVDEVDSGRA